MKNFSIVSVLLLTATLSSGAMAAAHHVRTPEAGSNMDTAVQTNHIDVNHAFDKENLTAGNLL